MFELFSPGDSDVGDEAGDEDQSSEDRKALLRQLIAAGGDLGKLAIGALEALEEREAKAQQEADALAVLEVGAAAGRLDFDDPAVLEAIRIRERQKQALADEQLIAATRKHLAAQGFADSEIASQVAEIRAQQAVLAQETADVDPLFGSRLWQMHAISLHAEERAVALAEDVKANRPGEWERVVETAQAGIDATVDGVLEG